MNKKIWTVFLGVITIIGTIFGVYGIFKSDTPSLRFEVQSEYDVFNTFNEESPFEIKYNEKNIAINGKSLKAIKLLILNDGNKDISKNDFDTNIPFKLKLDNAKFTGPVILSSASSKYLKDNIVINKESDTTIMISPIHFERDEYVEIEFLFKKY